MFEGLRARLERLLLEHTRVDPRSQAAGLTSAMLDAKVALATMRDALAATERELAAERKRLADAERRGRLAAEVPDPETVTIAGQFAERHRSRIALLERKSAVQRDELVLAERELAELGARLREVRQGGAGAELEAAWRDLEAAGGVRPDLDLDDDLSRVQADRRRHEQAVEAQLAHLKKKLGKE